MLGEEEFRKIAGNKFCFAIWHLLGKLGDFLSDRNFSENVSLITLLSVSHRKVCQLEILLHTLMRFVRNASKYGRRELQTIFTSLIF